MSEATVGSEIEVTIEKPVYRGLGLARHEGQVVFVPRGLSGERLRVRVAGVERGYLRAEPTALLEASPDRRASPCPYVPACGGCAYQELDYAAQLRLKEAVLRDALLRAGVGWQGELSLRSGPERGWRVRAALHFQPGAEPRLGLHREGTRRVVDLERCLQLSDSMNQAARGLLKALGAHPGRGQGVGGVDLAEAADGRGLAVGLHTALQPEQAAGLGTLARDLPSVTGLGALAGLGNRRRFVSLQGTPYVQARVLGLDLRCHVRSFFQANRFLVEDLARRVADWAVPEAPVLDLYSGVGLFALPLAARGVEVLGVELSPHAIADAKANAEAAGLRNVRFRQGDVAAFLQERAAQAEQTVVLDPPRTGLGARVVQAVARRAPRRIVYVSCDPPTLARDLKLFAAAGYGVEALEAFDMFPDTFHLEAVALLVPSAL